MESNLYWEIKRKGEQSEVEEVKSINLEKSNKPY